MNLIFFLMSPFFFFSGLIFMICSMFLSSLSLSIFISWNFYFMNFSLDFPMYLDFVSCFFISMVLIISSCILVYSEFYMSSDFFKSRFFYLMFMFVMSMVFLILSPSVFCMLLGWDGLGLVSYCLVIYYQSFSSYCSGFLTALTNRLGDVLILCSLSMCSSYGSWNYMNFLDLKNLSFLIFFFIASLTKSAQIPFSSWLPAAMAAPTPVSSLVHSSTLVTAGVYILIRFSFFLSESVKMWLMLISLLTMIMAGISAIFEYDLKKIIALSTLSQLGFMMSSISLGFKDLAFFHLVTHAGFKALLFMCAGVLIHSFFDNQDIRGYGFLSKDFFVVVGLFNVANLSLCGFPFLSGFFSKDLILEMLVKESELKFPFFFLFSFGTFLTVLYSFRLFFLMSFKPCLYPFSVSVGFIGSSCFFFPMNFIVLPLNLKLYVLLICFMSFFLSFLIINLKKIVFSYFLDFFSSMWFLYFLKTDMMNGLFLKFSSYFSYSSVGFVELHMGQKPIKTFFYFSNFLSSSSKIFFFLFVSFFFMYSFLIFCLLI